MTCGKHAQTINGEQSAVIGVTNLYELTPTKINICFFWICEGRGDLGGEGN